MIGNFKDLCEAVPESGLSDSVYDFIGKLQQPIKRKDAENWLNFAARMRPIGEKDTPEARVAQMWWLLLRLKGLGGSDVHDAISPSLGVPAGFQSPSIIFDQKRMKLPPLMGDARMRAGTLLEKVAQSIYQMDFKMVTCEESMSVFLKNSGNIPGYEFLVGNPDDVVVSSEGYPGKILVDYKAPANVNGSNPLSYEYQLHHYDLIYNNGNPDVSIGKKMDVYYDHSKGITVPIEVDHDPEKGRNILKHGSMFWDMVCDKNIENLPETYAFKEPVSKKHFHMENVDKIHMVEMEAMRISALADTVNKAKDELNEIASPLMAAPDGLLDGVKDNIEVSTLRLSQKIADEAELSSIIFANGQDPSALMKVSSYWDNSKLKEFLEKAGANPNDFKKKEFDIEKVVQFLQEKGIDCDRMIKPSVSVFPNSRKKTVKPILEATKMDARSLVSDFINGKEIEPIPEVKDDVKDSALDDEPQAFSM